MRTLARRYAPCALLLLLAACGDDPEPADAEHEAIAISQWNGATELFLEYPPLVAGRAGGNWAIHLTALNTFKPIIEGRLTVRFLGPGGPSQTFTIDAPARPGIYLLDPVVEQPGTYQVELALESPQARSIHRVPDVVVHSSVAAIPADEAAEGGGGIAFLKEQQWVIPFAVAPARTADVARTVDAPGEIVPMDGRLAAVSAPMAGIALAPGNLNVPSVGDPVRQGTTLAVLSPAPGDVGYAGIRSEVDRLSRAADREARLLTAGAIAGKRLEETRRALAVARAELAALGGGGGADFRYAVRAPIAGVIAERSFVPGGRVEAGQPLFTVVDPRAVWLRARLEAADAAEIPGGATARFTAEGSPIVRESGPLVSVGSVLDFETRTVPAVFTVDNSNGGLKVGQYVNASIPVGGTARGVAIPTAAILDDGGIPVAYVQVEGESFERRRLRLGTSDGVRTIVLEGIRDGERVVELGAYQVRLASMSDVPLSGGHAH